MANTAGLCNTFKTDLMNGVHAFSIATGGKAAADTFYGALYLATATLSSASGAYTTAGEISATGTYSAGGQAITNASAPANTAGTTYWTPSGSMTWTGVTITGFDTLLIYNSTVAGKNAVGVFTFSSQSITSGTFTLTMPTNNSTTGLIRIA
jgi:hypothetical protein